MNNTNNQKFYGVPLEIFQSIVSTICKNRKIKKIVLFGSRAKGNYKNGSDIDIAVFSKNLSYNEFMKIKVELSKLMIPYTVDIIDYNSIKNDDLIEHISRVGKVLFHSNSKVFNEFWAKELK